MRKILDLGCGRGEKTYNLKIKNPLAEVIGIDIEKENIKKAEERFGNECKFFVAQGEKLPFENSYFDEIYSIEVLEHVINLKKTLEEIDRVLKRKGKLIFTFPNSESEKALLNINPDYFKSFSK